MTTSSKVTSFATFINAHTPGAAVTNQIVPLPEGIDVANTVISVGQITQPVVSLATSGMGGKAVGVVPGAGAILIATSVFLSSRSIDAVKQDAA